MNRSISRRQTLQAMAVSLTGLTSGSWMPAMAQTVGSSPSQPKAVILLWLNGGPSTIDLWDLKPGHDNGGPFREVATNVPGTRISENLPQLASMASEFSVIRSMSTREGDHTRARRVSTTGYAPQGAIQFPPVGSVLAHELADVESAIPPYVHIGGQPAITGGGFLGPQYAPFVVAGSTGSLGGGGSSGDLSVANLTRPQHVSLEKQTKRLAFFRELRGHSSIRSGSPVVGALDSATDRALRLMRPDAAAAFDLDQENTAMRESYGAGTFGQGCLMARRLVQRGVRCVEVTLGGWDTHSNNFEQVKSLSQQLDQGFAMLLSDLKSRGMLENTLVVCQGEFGRTPRINGQAGRDHWPASWAVALAGAGIQGGRVIGETSADGMRVQSRPTSTSDLMATLFQSINIDPRKQNMSNVSRPIRLADPDGNVVEELL